MQNQLENQYTEQEISLKDYYRVLVQYKWLVITMFIVVFVATAIYTAYVPRIYKASCKILIEEKDSNSMLFMATDFSNNSINNTIEILKSRPVVKVAVNILKKNKNYRDFPISDPEVNPEKYIIGNIAVQNKRDTDVLEIGFESTNPFEAQAIVDAAAEALMEQNTSYARMELTNVRDFLEKNLDSISRRLRNSEEELRRYKLDNGIVELTGETEKLIENSSKVESMVEEANTERKIAVQRLSYLQGQLTKQDSLLLNVNSILSSPLLDQLRENVVTSQTRLAKLLTKSEYNANHPELKILNDEIENAKKKLNEEIQRVVAVRIGSSDPLVYRGEIIQQIATVQVELKSAETKYKSLLKISSDYNKRMSLLPDTELELARKTRTYSMNEKVYSMLVEKHEDAKITEQAKMGNIRLVESADLPSNPIKPKKTMNLLIGFVLGIGSGIGLALILHSLDSKIRTLDDVENYVNLPIAGTIPFIDLKDSDLDSIVEDIKQATGKEKEELIASHKMMTARLITHYAPKSPISESYRTLRTNILAKHPAKDCITMSITSTGPKEGKSTTTSNLAIALSQMDAKVVLIDLDMRRPMLHTLFNVEKENGSSDYLYDKSVKVEQVICETNVKNLDLITSGFIPPNPSELISSKRMDQFLEELKEYYDYILIDTPPVIAVTDALIIGKKVDLMSLVIRVTVTDRNVLKRVKEIMNNVHVNIAGVIVNGIEAKRYYSGYGNYYYYYSQYYHEDEDKNKKNGKKSKR
jgi:tyrosine-protein kinase Etk/Wzc